MKKNISIAVLALLYTSEVSAVRLRDIFDAYDVESKKELLQTDDNIDPATLTAEIGGDQIAKDVKSATAGVADNTMVQLSNDPLVFAQSQQPIQELSQGPEAYKARRITDKDQDGVEDNQTMDSHERDKFYIPNVYSAPVEDLHNTGHGRLPGHHRADDFPPPNVSAEKYMNDKEAKDAKAAANAPEKKEEVGATLGLQQVLNGALAYEGEKEDYFGPNFQPLEQVESTDPGVYDLVQFKTQFRPKETILSVNQDENVNGSNVDINNIPDRSDSEYDGAYVQLRQQKLALYTRTIEGPADLQLLLIEDNDLADRDVLPKSVEQAIKEDHQIMPSSLETMIAGDEIEADDSINADLIEKLSKQTRTFEH